MTVVTCPVGIGTTDDETINIYPNPASDQLHVSAKNIRIEEMKIYSATGVLVNSDLQGVSTIDIRGLSSGIYFLEIRFRDATRMYRFAKM